MKTHLGTIALSLLASLVFGCAETASDPAPDASDPENPFQKIEQEISPLEASCVWDNVSLMTVTLKDGETAIIAQRSVDKAIVVNGNICVLGTLGTDGKYSTVATTTPALVTATKLKGINVVVNGTAGKSTAAGSKTVIIDYTNGLFAPAVYTGTAPAVRTAGTGISINLNLPTNTTNASEAGVKAVGVKGTTATDTVAYVANTGVATTPATYVPGGVDMNKDGRADIMYDTTTIDKNILALGLGADIYTSPAIAPATPFAFKAAATNLTKYIEVYGGAGADTFNQLNVNVAEHIHGGTSLTAGKQDIDTVNYSALASTTDTGRAAGVIVTLGDAVIVDGVTSARTGNDGAAGEKDSLYGDIEVISGTSQNDSILADTSVTTAVTLNGLAGDDTLSGGTSADIIDGGTGTDTVSYAARTAAVTIDLTLATATQGAASENDKITNVENVIGGFGADKLTACKTGSVLTGGPGDDTLTGGLGGDTFPSWTAFDGSDIITGGLGTDTVSYEARTKTPLRVTIATGASPTPGGFYYSFLQADNVTAATAVCGNGVVEFGEECEDGNSTDIGDGCTNLCVLETNAYCTDVGQCAVAACATLCQAEGVDCTAVGGDEVEGGITCEGAANSEVIVPVAGNGIVEKGEQCDDGNTANEDGCDEDGVWEGALGNYYYATVGEKVTAAMPILALNDGVVSTGEQCDDGNLIASDGCGATNLVEANFYCGDAGDACLAKPLALAGNKVSGTAGTDNVCGNSVTDAAVGEQCDLGATNGGVTACSKVCTTKLTTCGNSTVNAGEECDDGVDGSLLCTHACKLKPAPVEGNTVSGTAAGECGDGVTDDNEECDLGDDVLTGNGVVGNTCSSVCTTMIATCGNSAVDGVEACDAGLAGSYKCTPSCKLIVGTCGDSTVDPGEECDAGATNGDAAVSCSANCYFKVSCGDGNLDFGEFCDDGNILAGDGCSATCTFEDIHYSWTLAGDTDSLVLADHGIQLEEDTIGSDIENVTGGAGDDVLTGNASDNEIVGGAGDDTLNGGAGDDTIEGGAGDDVIDCGDGMDINYSPTGGDVAADGVGCEL